MTDSGQSNPKKTQGSKDSKLVKHNKNVTAALPDRQAEYQKEQDMATRLVEADSRRTEKGNLQYGLDSMLVMIALRRDGLTIRQIAAKRQVGAGKNIVKIPCEDAIYRIMQGNPEFHENMTKAKRDYHHDVVENGIQSIPRIGKIACRMKGDKAVYALNVHARAALALGRQALPDEYGGAQDIQAEVIVFEANGGWAPAETARHEQGKDVSQGRDALEAAERWRKMRESSEDGMKKDTRDSQSV